MATPTNSSWSAPPQPPAGQSARGDESGLQVRPMGLKVHYTFDREGQIHCLARWPQILHIQTAPLDDRNTIGVVDLRTCLQAVAQCSPEIVNQQDTDYSVYAYDYSEPNMPLVGQGMLSWCMNQNNDQQQQQAQQQLVTGRVTRSVLTIMSNGSRETLEVRLKMTSVAKTQQMQQRAEFSGLDQTNHVKAGTPTDTASEWESFIQSNPMLGHSANVASMPSPALPPAQMSNFNHSMSDNRYMDTRTESAPPQLNRPGGIPPAASMPQSVMPHANMGPTPRYNSPRPFFSDNAPSSSGPQPPMEPVPEKPRPSRPTSRASRSRAPTGRPRGRPRKKPLETGNTSATEEATDGDEGPQKKRAKTIKTEYSAITPFGSAPDSLRVAASTSGSLRNMRPVGAVGDGPAANRLQDIPRAPTPIPDGPLMQKQQKRRLLDIKSRSDSVIEVDGVPLYQSTSGQTSMSRSFSQDAQSPAESNAPSPDRSYTPADSPADLGSSPPVPRTGAYMHSSPLASSPVLPTMPLSQVDSGFMSGGIDNLFDDDDLMRDFPQGQMQELPGPMQDPVSATLPPTSKPTNRKENLAEPQQPTKFPFREENPGPPELLPITSIFNPAGKVKTLNRPPISVSAPPPAAKKNNRPLKRSHTAPNPKTLEKDTEPESQQPQEPQELQQPQPPEQSEHPDHQPELPHLPQPDVQPEVIHQEAAGPKDLSDSEISLLLVQTIQQEQAKERVLPSNSASAQGSEDEDAQIALLAAIQEDGDDTILPTIEPPAGDITLSLPAPPTSRPSSRGAPLPPPDTATNAAAETTTRGREPVSESSCLISDADSGRYNKNQVKKYAIKERLITAIEKGEMPPFCNNCGAIETPTWRKIWTQEHKGVPGFHEFSDKAGYVTMIDVMQRGPDGKPTMYKLVKKNLGPRDDKKLWTESLLCNPCGIWLAKFKTHRPSDRWDKDAARLNQPRRKREAKGGNSKSKKARTKSDSQMNPTSEAYFTTDPIGPADPESPKDISYENEAESRQQSMAAREDDEQNQSPDCMILNSRGSQRQRGPGSTHSRGSGTADSPIAVEDDLGTTRRLLFPSPRKDGLPKVLGELAVNVVQTTTNSQEQKSASAGKENIRSEPKCPGTPVHDDHNDHDDLEIELFGTPPNRPSTPPPKTASSGVFKTPTRPTPSHRPITRSISRSIRTVRTVAKSPDQIFGQLHRTPSKTPRSSASNGMILSASKRKSPRNTHLHAHFALDDLHMVHIDSPLTATLNQLLSEANDFTAGSPSHGLVDIDLSSLPNLDSDGIHLGGPGALDFGNYLSTDMIMPSSPPLLKNHGGLNFGGSLAGFSGASADDMWAEFIANKIDKDTSCLDESTES
ncbi:hypothetical protein B0T26DRAFT_166003 [Lasiosphaeria miniovina]|uniref:Ams2/SPT21 N-terminal domain-containing protein n=1 Tax=Lasiosphaeria miniovina TaxID=1954250 RepID=A0AA40B661_9PEZI|nr:uncharacterized protein B0T26DRAFT_166003 [Lasiosphaeria miniovina]KAK0728267.1 hypothetical protein B0T26DRAFT_166003 [Lasiosphaeria miniovina]